MKFLIPVSSVHFLEAWDEAQLQTRFFASKALAGKGMDLYLQRSLGLACIKFCVEGFSFA